MARIKRAVFGVLIALALCGCTCGLAGCADAETKAVQTSRFKIEFHESHGAISALDHMVVDLVTDTETGRRWMVVCTSHGVALAPLEGGQDGTVSDQH